MMSNLLVITNWYPQVWTNRYHCNFVKEFTDLISWEFDNIYVICPQPYFPKILRRFRIFENYCRYSNFENYKYGNVKVFFPTYFTLPLKYFRENNRKYWFDKVCKIIRNEHLDFDIVHCHFINQSWVIWKELKKIYKDKKIIIHCHDSTLKKDLKTKSWKYREIFKWIDASISFCEHYDVLNNFLKENKCKCKNVYIPNFIDTKKFYPKDNIWDLRKKYWFKTDDKILICIWNIIYEHKWQNDILEIWKDLENTIKNLHLILIWDWPDKEKMLNTINSLNTDRIHYLWPKSNQEIIDYLNISNLFLFPSRYESFWIAPIEAISCWIPVIAYKNWWSEYIFNDWKVWLILNKQDISDLKNWVIKILQSEYDKDYLHKYIVNKFSWKVIKKELLDLYFGNMV